MDGLMNLNARAHIGQMDSNKKWLEEKELRRLDRQQTTRVFNDAVKAMTTIPFKFWTDDQHYFYESFSLKEQRKFDAACA